MSPLPFVNVIVLLDTEAVSKEEAVIELCTNPNSVIWAEPETVPEGIDSPPAPNPAAAADLDTSVGKFIIDEVVKLPTIFEEVT